MLACNVMFIIANIREQGTMSNAHAVLIWLITLSLFLYWRVSFFSQLKGIKQSVIHRHRFDVLVDVLDSV